AARVSTRLMSACAYGLRTKAACSIPSSRISATYVPRPATRLRLCSPGTGAPTAFIRAPPRRDPSPPDSSVISPPAFSSQRFGAASQFGQHLAPEGRDCLLDAFVRGAARMAHTQDQVIRLHLFLPHLELLEAVLGRPRDEAVGRRDVEGPLFLRLDVLYHVVHRVAVVAEVEPVRVHQRLALAPRRLPRVRNQHVTHQDKVGSLALLARLLAVEIGELLDHLHVFERRGDPGVGDPRRALEPDIGPRRHPDRRTRLLQRLWRDHPVVELVELAAIGEALSGSGRLDDFAPLFAAARALADREPEGAEVALLIADADAQDHPPAGYLIDDRRVL